MGKINPGQHGVFQSQELKFPAVITLQVLRFHVHDLDVGATGQDSGVAKGIRGDSLAVRLQAGIGKTDGTGALVAGVTRKPELGFELRCRLRSDGGGWRCTGCAAGVVVTGHAV